MDTTIDADFVVYRLEEAGATLLAMPGSGWSTKMRSSSIEIVRTALEAYGWTESRILCTFHRKFVWMVAKRRALGVYNGVIVATTKSNGNFAGNC